MAKEEEIRSEVIKTAKRLFQQFGYSKTTMEDIAKAMGKGKSTLYYYYSSKDEIFDSVTISEVNEIFFKVKNTIDKDVSAEGKIRSYVLTMFKEVKKKISLYNIVTGELNENYKIIQVLRKKIDSIEINIVTDILTLGMKSKEFSINGKDIDMLAYSMVSAFRGLEIDLIVENKFHDWVNRVDIIIDILIKGLRK